MDLNENALPLDRKHISFSYDIFRRKNNIYFKKFSMIITMLDTDLFEMQLKNPKSNKNFSSP